MAIKLITKGIPPQEKVYKTTCSSCHSTYEYTKMDLKHCNDPRDPFSYFDCEVCGVMVIHRS